MSDYSLFDDALKEYENQNNEKSLKLSEFCEEKTDCEHTNVCEDNGFISCSDCGIEMNKNIYQDNH